MHKIIHTLTNLNKNKSVVERYYCLGGETYTIKTSLLFSCYVGPFWHFFPRRSLYRHN